MKSCTLCQTRQENPPVPGGDFPVFALLCLAHIALRVAIASFRNRRARKAGGPNMLKLNLPRAVAVPPPAPVSLCASCAFAHVVRGYLAAQELVVCGYAFPSREVLFAVRECTDHKPKRERSGVEIACEGTVCSPSLELQADNFRVAAAARNGSGW